MDNPDQVHFAATSPQDGQKYPHGDARKHLRQMVLTDIARGFSYAQVAAQYGLNRNQVAGIVWRSRPKTKRKRRKTKSFAQIRQFAKLLFAFEKWHTRAAEKHAALKIYGGHLDECTGEECSCGLDEALRK